MPEPPKLITNLDGRPDYAAAVGNICAEWANLEWHMFHLYASLSGSPPALARATFGSIESNRGRIEMILACCQTSLIDKDELEKIDRLLAKIRKTATRRNNVVHNLWCVADTPQREVMQLFLSEKDGAQCVEGIALNDLVDLANRIHELADYINSARERLSHTLPASLEKLRKQPGIALVFARKGHPPGRKPKGFHGQR